MSTATLDLPVVDVYTFATDYEKKLYKRPQEEWGDEATRARRGAKLLDRALPDWFARVEVLDLDLSSSCKCVIGQIWAPVQDSLPSRGSRAFWSTLTRKFGAALSNRLKSATHDDTSELSDPFNTGVRVWGLREREEGYGSMADFYGFDVLGDGHDSYDTLQKAWEKEIQRRLAKSA